MFEKFTNQYSLSKTLRFSLIPVGKTEENFNDKLLLNEDEDRAKDYQKVKKFMDEYHKFFIESVLNSIIVDSLHEYSSLYFMPSKSDKELDQLGKIEASMRKQISKAFKKDSRYAKLSKKEFIRELLPDFLESSEEKEIVAKFDEFSTYFIGFFQNRENMYTDAEQSTAISYRCINDNLPKFLDNVKSFDVVSKSLYDSDFEELNANFSGLYGVNVQDVFTVDYFNFVLSQTGIDKYNQIIGGYSNSDGSKIKGINEYINLYNQQVAKNDKSKRLPLMRPLFKQILSDRDSVSFLPESFNNDNEVLKAINTFYADNEYGIKVSLNNLSMLFSKFDSYNLNGIHITNGLAITDLSKAVFDNWNTISACWKKKYEILNPMKSGKSEEKYLEAEDNAYKKTTSFTIEEIETLVEKPNSVVEYYTNKVAELILAINNNFDRISSLVSNEYNDSKRLSKNNAAIDGIKAFLDSIKDLERLLKPLNGSGKEEYKDTGFYAVFSPLLEAVCNVDGLYNKVRNYVTQKPYSKDKIKLNFSNSHFMNVWAQNYDTKGAIVIQKNNSYYLAIVDKKFKGETIEYLTENAKDDLAYRLIPDSQKPDNKNTPRLFIRSKGDNFAPAVEEYNLPIEDVIDLYDNGYFKTEFRSKNPEKYKESLTKLIDYFKLGFSLHDSYKHYNFVWKNSSEYSDISEFYRDVITSCYQIVKEAINFKHLLELADNGSLYLFQIYNKDFSKYSKGTPNLHTLYFKMLFDNDNLSNVVYKLSGGAEMFYRKASIKENEKIVHPANQPIDNKNSDNNKKQSTFAYDLIKDKRFTKRQFSLHIPIAMNFKADGNNYINYDVRKALKASKNNYVIGIDRGERNLIYVCVIDENGKIVEQYSLNEIVSSNGYKVDYHKLLDSKESDRDKARKDWKEIGTIKELKEGYISQVVHKICQLVVKYDAIIAMEDLNTGFMNSRKKVEKQVYQKFEKMLTDKLNFLVDKNIAPTEMGGLLNAYQLTNKADTSRKGRQDGIVFYIPAWLTSKIDPTTGFVSLIKPKYTSIEASQEFFDSFDDIRYNSQEDYFEFDIDYSRFPKCNADYKRNWTVCTNADRIRTFRNPNKNNEWDNQVVILTDEFKALFEKYEIDYSSSLQEKIICQNDKGFFKELMYLLSLTLQMRNSETGNVDIDYLISPIKNSSGNFYDSRKCDNSSNLPANADANGAYNIARKGLWAINQIKQCDDITKVDLAIKNANWLEYAQNV